MIALPLGWITNYIRTHLADSPVYEQMMEEAEAGGQEVGSKTPVRDVIRKYPRTTIICFGSAILNAIGFYACISRICSRV